MTAPVTVGVGRTGQRAAGELGDLGERQRDHAGAPSGSRPEDLAQHRAVVEGVHGARDLLAGLVALAGDEHGVARAGQADGRGDRGAPVADLEHLGAVGRRDVARRRPAWRRGWRRGPRSAGCRRSRPGHRCRRAAAVPIAARLPGSRSPPQPSTVISRPLVAAAQRGQRRGDGVRGVGVVDDGDERLAGVDGLHPARDDGLRDAGQRRPRPARRRRRAGRRRGRRWRR